MQILSMRVPLLLIISLLASCSSTIGNRASFEEVEFVVGETTKQEVSAVLGLPAKIKKNSELLMWGYTKSSRVSAILVPSISPDYAGVNPVNNVNVTMKNIELSEVADKEFENAAMVYGFDEQGVLRRVIDQRISEK